MPNAERRVDDLTWIHADDAAGTRQTKYCPSTDVNARAKIEKEYTGPK